jgi:TPR repeat protein
MAAEEGWAVAMVNLALLIEDDDHGGDLNEPDDEDYPACTAIMFNLALLLQETGRREEALHWYERAAERGDEEAAEEAARLHAASRE